MSGAVAVRPTRIDPAEAWQVTADNLVEVARAVGSGRGSVDGEPCVWLDLPDEDEWNDPGRPAFVGQWIVRTFDRVLLLSAEEFAAAWEIVP